MDLLSLILKVTKISGKVPTSDYIAFVVGADEQGKNDQYGQGTVRRLRGNGHRNGLFTDSRDAEEVARIYQSETGDVEVVMLEGAGHGDTVERTIDVYGLAGENQ